MAWSSRALLNPLLAFQRRALSLNLGMTSRFWWLLLAATPAACSRWQRPPPALKFAASTGAGGGGGGGGEFWDGQHAHAPREWYANATVLLPLLRPLLQPKDDILHVGCGTSTIGSMLFNEGFVNIVETDKSHVALAIVERQARALTSTRTQIQRFLWSDATALPETFPPAQFDAVLDKGLLDAVCTAVGEQAEPVRRVLQGTGRSA